jgi:hypothetical protein
MRWVNKTAGDWLLIARPADRGADASLVLELERQGFFQLKGR